MFTGLIQAVGTISAVGRRGNYRILTVASELADNTIRIGESIACDGACLTVVKQRTGSFVVEASQETARRTILADYRNGARINLERALQVGDRLGGHFVMGHVDTVGRVDYCRSVGESLEIALAYGESYDSLVIEKGSIAINGVSLTVNEVKPGWLSVNVIPHTVGETTIGDIRGGRRVNLEFDMIGKYVLKSQGKGPAGSLTLDKLRESGW
jgi:riboflavin synthase